MERVVVVGTSGAGKTTFAEALAHRLRTPHLELDSVYHQPGWTPIEDVDFVRVVTDFVARDRWVVDGNYTSTPVADLVWDSADTVVWLDPPRRRVMWRVTTRTLHRVATRRILWNGNTESWRNLVKPRPEDNIIVWAWTTFDANRDKYENRVAEPRWRHVTVHRIRSERSADELLRSVEIR